MNISINVIEPVGGHGGMNYYNTGLGLGLSEAGASSSLYTSSETVESSSGLLTVDKCFVDVFGAKNKFLRFYNYIKGVLHATKSIKRRGGRFAHLHFFQYGALELFTCMTLRLFGLSIIATIHDVESFSSGKVSFFQRYVLSACSHFIVHNAFSKSELEDTLSLVRLVRPINVIPHGNYKSFVQSRDKESSRLALGLPANCDVLLFFGQIKEVKGLDILLDAFAKVKSKKRNVVLVIAGKTWKTDFIKYEKKIQSLGLESDVVTHIRYIPDQDVGNYYSASDIVLLPYKKIYQSGVLLMAMSYAKPVIASDLPPMQEIIIDGENGFLFESENSGSFADVILRALSSNLASVGNSANNTMEGDFSWESVAKKHIEVYKLYES
ncbi:MAG: glycosyltransferase [Colwellia sp.]|jgi:Glycosyltransferase